MRFRLPLLLGLAFALAGLLAIQAIALMHDRAGVAARARAATLDEVARTVSLRVEYQLLRPAATAIGRAMFGDSDMSARPSVATMAGRVRHGLAGCACVSPNGLAVDLRDSLGPPGSLARWLEDTVRRQLTLSHLASYNLVGHGSANGGGQVLFGLLATSPPRPAGLFGYGAHIAPGGRTDNLFAIELDPAPFIASALADTTVNPGTDTGELAFRRPAVTLDVSDAAGRALFTGAGERWAPGLRVRTLPGDLARLRLRIYAARLPATPPSGAGLLLVLALFVVTLTLTAIAVLQLRGEHELARRRSRFVSGVSHELRTPLTQIRLFAELLRDEQPAVQAKRFEYARIIDEEAQRLTYLVDNVLAYSALTDVIVRRDPVDLTEIVRDTIERFEPLADARAARLRQTITDGIVVPGDDHALRRVLLNLLDNAVKYGPHGQTVTIDLHAVDHRAELTVDDAGPGIPIADRARVFEPFVRLDHDAQGGSGIGLAIVRDLVLAMHGTVVIEAAPSGGARVRLTLPL